MSAKITNIRVFIGNNSKETAQYCGTIMVQDTPCPIFKVGKKHFSGVQDVSNFFKGRRNLRKRKIQRNVLQCSFEDHVGRTIESISFDALFKEIVSWKKENSKIRPFVKLSFLKGLVKENKRVKLREKKKCVESKPPQMEECCICLEDVAVFDEISHLSYRDRNIPYACVPVCGNLEHVTCIQCMRKMILNKLNEHVTSCGEVPCFEKECGCLDRWTLQDIKSILSKKEYTSLQKRIDDKPINAFIKITHVECGNEILVNSAEIKNKYEHFVDCPHCDVSFCYFCQQIETEYQCCQGETKMPNEMGFLNRYIVNMDGAPPSCDFLMRNYEITEDMVWRNVKEIITDYKNELQIAIRCSKCTAKICRESMCHEMTHCECSKCSLCGMSACNETALIDHYTNVHPRFTEMEFQKLNTHRFFCILSNMISSVPFPIQKKIMEKIKLEDLSTFYGLSHMLKNQFEVFFI
jgi:hypothetical protein